MIRSRFFVSLVAMVAAFSVLPLPVLAAPPSAQVQPVLDPLGEAMPLVAPVDFPASKDWTLVGAREQGGVHLMLFSAEATHGRLRVIFGKVEVSAEMLVQAQLQVAEREGFVSAGTIRSIDGNLVSVRVLRSHGDGSGMVDDAIIAARVSPETGAGIIFIGQRSGEHDNALVSQVQHALLHTTFAAR